jgi:TonB family protein
MKEILLSSGRWMVVGMLLALVGILVVTGIGRRRGTRAYRVRMALWQAVLVVVGGATLLGLTVGQQGCRDKETSPGTQGEFPLCYAPVAPPQEQVKGRAVTPQADIVITGDARPSRGASHVPDVRSLAAAEAVPANVPEAKSPGDPEVEPVRGADPRGGAPDVKLSKEADVTPDAAKLPDPKEREDKFVEREEKFVMCYVARSSSKIESKVLGTPELTRFLRARSGAIQKCYQERLRRAPQLAGRVVLDLTVAPNGRATASVVKNETGDAELAACMVEKIGKWSFPKPEKEISVKVPFVFNAL